MINVAPADSGAEAQAGAVMSPKQTDRLIWAMQECKGETKQEAEVSVSLSMTDDPLSVLLSQRNLLSQKLLQNWGKWFYLKGYSTSAYYSVKLCKIVKDFALIKYQGNLKISLNSSNIIRNTRKHDDSYVTRSGIARVRLFVKGYFIAYGFD